MQAKANLNRYLEIGVRSIYHAEQQICESLLPMANQSSSSELQKIFKKHHRETEHQIERLRQVADSLCIDLDKSRIAKEEGIVNKSKEAVKTLLTMNPSVKNKALEGLIEQGKEILSAIGDDDKEMIDLALAAGAQLIEEFEVISYHTLLALAAKVGNKTVANLFKKTLEEEEEAFKALKKQFEKKLEGINVEETVGAVSSKRG